MHHMAQQESSRFGDMRVNDVIKEIGGMNLSDVMKTLKRIGLMPGSEMGDAMKRIEMLPMPRDYVAIPIEDLEKSPADDGISTDEYRLPRVPQWVRAVNPDAYIPRFICIGPYHRGKNGNPLRQENLKKDFVNRLWEYCEPDIKDCLAELREEVEKTRRFYLETFDDIDNDEWVMMLLLDGCFFIMHLLNFTEREYEFPTNWAKTQVKIDLALLENQLPFFILEKIFNLFFTNFIETSVFCEDISTTLRGMAVYVWVSRRPEDFKAMKTVKDTNTEVPHLVHLIHMAHCDMIDDAEQVADQERKSEFLFTKIIIAIWKAICFCPIKLLTVFTCDEMMDEEEEAEARAAGQVKDVEQVLEALEVVGKEAMSAVANVAAKASEAAEKNKKGKAAAAVEAGANEKDYKNAAAAAMAAAAAVTKANRATAMAAKILEKAKDAEELAAFAKKAAEDAKGKEAAAKAKKAVDALNKAHRAAATKLKAAADAWKFAAESANKAALEAANIPGVADEAKEAAKEAMAAAAAAAVEAASPRLPTRPRENIASAMDLHKMGIQFVTTKRAGSKYHVRISSNDEDKLVIPPVVVSGTTAPLLHNLIALEQQGKGKKTEQNGRLIIGDHFTKYAFLMYNLVNSDEDISLLQKRGILLNNYGTNEQVISYFKNLLLWNSRLPRDYSDRRQTRCGKVKEFCTNLHQWNCPLRGQGDASRDGTPATGTMAIVRALDALEARSKHRAYRDRAEIKRKCNSPLQVLLLIASIVIFVSTILQMVTSFYGH